MDNELEGVKDPQAEVVVPTQEEGAESTTPKGEPTVEKTYTQSEHDKALGKGLESMNRQLSLRDKALTAATTELEELRSTSTAKLEDLQGNLEDAQDEHRQALKAIDDPDIKASYTDRAAMRKREREADRREKTAGDKLKKAETLVYKQGLEAKAKVLHEETGIPLKELDDCKTDDEMEVKSLRYQMANPPKKLEPQEKEGPEFDSGQQGGGGGGDISSLPIDEKINALFKRGEKKKK